VRLTISNYTGAPIEFVVPPFEGDREDHFVTVTLPDGEAFVQEAIRCGYGGDAFGTDDVSLGVGERIDTVILLYRRNTSAKLLFADTGQYRIQFRFLGVNSNVLTVNIRPVPEVELPAHALFSGLPWGVKEACFDGRMMAREVKAESLGTIVTLALLQDSVVYSAYARYALAEKERYLA